MRIKGLKLENLERKVCVILDNSLTYPEKIPFDPPKNYAEYPFRGGLDTANKVYPAIRNALRLMNLDIDKYGSRNWSPLSEIIQKGDRVLIKPNLVLDKNLSGDSVFGVITHSSIIRAIVDYAFKATGDAGKIIIADASQNNADFQQLMEVTGLKEMVECLTSNFSVPLELYDLRKEQVVHKDGVIVERRGLPGDPEGYVSVDIGKESNLAEIGSGSGEFYGADYDRGKTTFLHNENHHVYIISRTALESDVIINLPKFKTHMKAGVTISLKNMIGIIGEKSSVPHYRVGSPLRGGDEYPELTSIYKRFLLRFNRAYSDLFLSRGLGANVYGLLFRLGGGNPKFGNESGGDNFAHSGNWCGNDTIWRSVLDINRIALFADKAGKIHKDPQRRMFILVDGIIGGEGQGPLSPKAKRCGALMCGTDPFSVDRVGARLMGFNEERIPLLSESASNSSSCDISIILSEKGNASMVAFRDLPNLHFKTPNAWRSVALEKE